MLDVNVLIALLDAAHVHHRVARTWLESQLTAAYLLALAVKHGGCLVTLDRAVPLAAARGAAAHHLKVL